MKSPCKNGNPFHHYNEDEVPLLLDEAKTMWSVGVYHENIVNLQGITAEEDGGILCRVRNNLQICSLSKCFHLTNHFPT